MSHALYSTRLYWAGMRGIAKLHGHEVRLVAPPLLPGFEAMILAGVDYVPEIHLAQVMPRGERWRDMTMHEIAASDRLLRAIVAAAAAL